MELHAAGHMNIKRSKKYDFPLYGVVTNGLHWIFVKYDPKLYDKSLKAQKTVLFVESSEISIKTDEELGSLLKMLLGILETQVDTLKKLKVKFTLIQTPN
jgi:hypothetical protein